MTRILRITLLSIVALSLYANAEEAPELPDQATQYRYRDEPLQWTSYSITVLGAEQLEETYRRDLEDIEGLAPGLLIDSASGYPRAASIAMRGVGSRDSHSLSFPVVAVTVDGVYMGTPASQDQPLFDLERIEVVRSPNGTFQGSPAPGGSINLFRRVPTGELGATARASSGDYNRKRFDGVFNFPLFDNVGAKLSVNLKRGGAKAVLNETSFRKENEDHYSGGSFAVRWQGDSGAAVQYTFDGANDKSDVPALLNLSSASDLLCDALTEANCSIDTDGILPETGAVDRSTQNFSNLRKYDIEQHAMHLDFSLLGHAIRSVTAIRNTEETSNQDLDATGIDFHSMTRAQDYKQVSEELSVFRQLTPAFSYTVGAYLLSQSNETDRSDFYIYETLANAGIIAAADPGEARTLHSEQYTKLSSIFGHIEYQTSERWLFDAGVKWTQVDHDIYHLVGLPGGPAVTEIDAAESNDEITGSAGLSYRVDDGASFFGRYTHSYRPGGFDDTANSLDGAIVGDEDVDLLEAGIKTQWMEDRLRFNYVFYKNKYRNKSERVTRVVSSGLIEATHDNVATVAAQGHELELEFVPVDNFSLRAAVSHMNADYTYYQVPGLTDPTTLIDLEARTPILAPSDMFQVSGRYSFPYGQGRVRIYAGYRFTKEYITEPTTFAGRVQNFTIINLSAEFAWREWTFRVFSRNSNGKRHLTNVTNPLDAEVVSLASTATQAQALYTSSEVNPPEFSGFEVVYVPRFGR